MNLCIAWTIEIPRLIRERTSEEIEKPSHIDALSECYTDPDSEFKFDLDRFKTLSAEKQLIAVEAIKLKEPEDRSSPEERVLAGEF